jgi:hypothetical protein
MPFHGSTSIVGLPAPKIKPSLRHMLKRFHRNQGSFAGATGLLFGELVLDGDMP